VRGRRCCASRAGRLCSASAYFADVFFADVFFADAFFADVFFADVFFADVFFADVFFADVFFAAPVASVWPLKPSPSLTPWRGIPDEHQV
jgi:hypothetical protein